MTKSNMKMIVGLAVPVLLVVGMAVASIFPSASNQGYAPEQPIPFSHKVHSGDNKIQCMYCHTSPEKSRHSTVPSVNVCMNCHTVVKADSPYIQQVKKHYEEGTPIEWVRVHELPDYVYFPHKRHLAKGLACETCHGDVASMDRVYQYSPLTMGWCMDCHKGNSTPENVLKQIYPKDKNPHGQAATLDCSACHH